MIRNAHAALAAGFCCLALPLSAANRPELAQEDAPEAFVLVRDGRAADVLLDEREWPGVVRAAKTFAGDVRLVADAEPRVLRSKADEKPPNGAILVGTIGRAEFLERLERERKLDLSPIRGKWESFLIQVADGRIVVAGSDKRGAIYGIYALSEAIGVSPWVWWADAIPEKRRNLFLKPGLFIEGPPKVQYRGLFINDEEPSFGTWARKKFGGVNSKMYAHVFELILRLRGNCLWPAMWGKAFNEDDPASPALADEFGIVMGTSHHEPMLRAQAEWHRHGKGPWNYRRNAENLRDFWRFGVERNRGFESIVTLGMRGDGDEPMLSEDERVQDNVGLLERIIGDQIAILKDVHAGKELPPTMWVAYKEALDYLDHGLRVPDDVAIMFADDNWGNVRRLPSKDALGRAGGFGLYYHADYVGGPRSYRWINVAHLPKMREQLNLAYENGIRRIWILNVGDLKPMEQPIDFFLRFAWDPESIGAEDVDSYQRAWARSIFGEEFAAEAAHLLRGYAKCNSWRTPELLDPMPFSLVHDREADRVLAEWRALAEHADELERRIPERLRDAFHQLIHYPVKAGATVAELQILAAKNRLYARQGRASAADCAQRVRELFELDRALADHYNKVMSGGKWDGMMLQAHIGRNPNGWDSPERNELPELLEPSLSKEAAFGVAVDGTEAAWKAGESAPALPVFDSMMESAHGFEVFDRGEAKANWTVQTNRDWILASEDDEPGSFDDRRIVRIDWDALPVGEHSGAVVVRGDGGEVELTVRAVKGDPPPADIPYWGRLTGPIAIPADMPDGIFNFDHVRWERLPDYGRGSGGMTIVPSNAESILPPEQAPHMTYRVFLPKGGEWKIRLVLSPVLNLVPERGLRIGTSFDEEQVRIDDLFDPGKEQDWNEVAADNARILETAHVVREPGIREFRITMVDPGVVVQKIVLYSEPFPKTYFGPRMSLRHAPSVPQKAMNHARNAKR